MLKRDRGGEPEPEPIPVAESGDTEQRLDLLFDLFEDFSRDRFNLGEFSSVEEKEDFLKKEREL